MKVRVYHPLKMRLRHQNTNRICDTVTLSICRIIYSYTTYRFITTARQFILHTLGHIADKKLNSCTRALNMFNRLKDAHQLVN